MTIREYLFMSEKSLLSAVSYSDVHAGVHGWEELFCRRQAAREDVFLRDVGERQLVAAVLRLDRLLAQQRDETL